MRRLPKIHVGRAHGRPRPILPSPIKPRADTGDEAELLGGMVQGKKASAPEERLFRALDEIGIDNAEFRYTIGAPRGLPGWKELDALIPTKSGLIFAVEVDTAFTHREKGRADVLHDAIVLQDLTKQGMNIWPKVIHLDGESDLSDRRWALNTVKRFFQ